MIPDILELVVSYLNPKAYKELMELTKRYTSQKYDLVVRRYRNKMSLYHWTISCQQSNLVTNNLEDKITLKSKILETLSEVNEFHIINIKTMEINDEKYLYFIGIIDKNTFGIPEGSYVEIKRNFKLVNFYYKFDDGVKFETSSKSKKYSDLDFLWKSLLSG